MRLFLLTIATLLIYCFSYAQEDLTGTWEGSGGGSSYAKLCITTDTLSVSIQMQTIGRRLYW